VTRDNKGRFDKGNPGGPGRPKRPTEVAYLNVVMSECSLADWQEISARAVSDAKTGDAKARDWLGKHLIGAVKAEAPTPMIVQQFALTGVDPTCLERARILKDGATFGDIDILVNTVEDNEKRAKALMKKDV
jgi:hypothetical protein